MLSGKCGRSRERLDRSTRIYGALAPGIQPVVIFLTLLHHRGVMQPQQTHPNASWLNRGGEPANSPQSQGETLGQIHLRWISISFTELRPQFGPFLRCKSDHSAPKQSNDGHVLEGSLWVPCQPFPFLFPLLPGIKHEQGGCLVALEGSRNFLLPFPAF